MEKIILLGIILSSIIISCSKDDSLPTTQSLNNQKTIIKPSALPSQTIPIYRFFKPKEGHFYTINQSEGTNNGYTYEGILTYVNSGSGFKCLTRWFNKSNGDRLILMDASEIANDIYTYSGPLEPLSPYIPGTNISPSITKPSGSWVYEGIFGRITNTTIYRYYNPYAKRHFFTSNYMELQNGNSTYYFEGSYY